MSEAKTIPAKYIFLDVVGFTHDRSVEAQTDIIQVLNAIVESSIREHGIRKDQVMFLPTSDDIGIALLNIGSPYDIHLSIAQRIISQVYRHSAGTTNKMRKFEVRAGINSNIDNLITDINGNQNIAGVGVNLAPRIMKWADGNQILVSETVFNELIAHEKYNSSFKPFRANIKQGAELLVYQLITNTCEGLNTAVPRTLQTFSQPEPSVKVPEPLIKMPVRRAPQSPPIPPKSADVIKPTSGQLPITLLPLASTSTSGETQSYLKGILPEPEKTAPEKIGWIKNKTESETLTFLDTAAPPKQNRLVMWASLGVLMLCGAGFGSWLLLSRQTSTLKAEKPAANTTNVATSSSPVSSAPSAPPSSVSSPAVTETAQSTMPDKVFSPNAAPLMRAETRSRNAAARRQASQPQRLYVARPAIQRTAAQSPKPKPQAKKQVVQTAKPKSSRRVTLDDLISDN